MATEHMRDGGTRAIRRGTHHGGGFSCWHTRAVGWAVSVAFTFLPKIEGYGGGSRPFFLYLSSSSPSSFSTFLLLLRFIFFPFLFLVLSSYTYILLCFYFFRVLFLLLHFRAVLIGFTSLNFFFDVRVFGHTRVMGEFRKAASVATMHVSKQQRRKWVSQSRQFVTSLILCTPIALVQLSSWDFLSSFEDPQGLKGLQWSRSLSPFFSTQRAREELWRIERSYTAWINQASPLRQWNFLVTWAARVARRWEGVSRVCRSQRYDDEERDTVRVGSRRWIFRLLPNSEGSSHVDRSSKQLSRRSPPVSVVPWPSADACTVVAILGAVTNCGTSSQLANFLSSR